jgi:hypothetical protein
LYSKYDKEKPSSSGWAWLHKRDFYIARGAQMSVLGSNCLHSYVRHTLSMLDAGDRMDHIAEELIRLATFADLNCACNDETGKYVADQFSGPDRQARRRDQ